MTQIIECVPNFSEGRDMDAIGKIVHAIASATVSNSGSKERVKVLDVDSGAAANRTVITFAGSASAVLEAIFQGVKCSSEVIDMRLHHGTHPRSGGCDVLPLVPVSGITLEECAQLARALAERIFKELGIPCYCYEAAAYKPARKDLAVCRAGEYESLREKIADPDRRPDFSPDEYNSTVARCGAINVGARNFLIAVNFNLNTTSVQAAKEIACDVREKGRKITNADGTEHWKRGTLKGCKAIGWYIDEYGIAQVSMNITDIETTPLHVAFDEVRRAAEAYGIQVTGTEIVGLVPKCALIDAGKHYLQRQDGIPDKTDDEIMDLAVKAMALDDLKPFDPRGKVIEYLMESKQDSGFTGKNT